MQALCCSVHHVWCISSERAAPDGRLARDFAPQLLFLTLHFSSSQESSLTVTNSCVLGGNRKTVILIDDVFNNPDVFTYLFLVFVNIVGFMQWYKKITFVFNIFSCSWVMLAHFIQFSIYWHKFSKKKKLEEKKWELLHILHNQIVTTRTFTA